MRVGVFGGDSEVEESREMIRRGVGRGGEFESVDTKRRDGESRAVRAVEDVKSSGRNGEN